MNLSEIKIGDFAKVHLKALLRDFKIARHFARTKPCPLTPVIIYPFPWNTVNWRGNHCAVWANFLLFHAQNPIRALYLHRFLFPFNPSIIPSKSIHHHAQVSFPRTLRSPDRLRRHQPQGRRRRRNRRRPVSLRPQIRLPFHR